MPSPRSAAERNTTKSSLTSRPLTGTSVVRLPFPKGQVVRTAVPTLVKRRQWCAERIRRAARRSKARDVCRARDDAVGGAADELRDQRRVGQRSGSHGDVEAVRHEIHRPVRQVDHHLKGRIGLEERRDNRREEQLPDRHGRRHPELAARLALQLGDGLLGGLEPGDGAFGLLDERHARVRERHPPRGAMEEPGAKLLLQLRNLPADGGLRQAERAGRAPEAAGLRHSHQGKRRVEVEVVHPRDNLSSSWHLVPNVAAGHESPRLTHQASKGIP